VIIVARRRVAVGLAAVVVLGGASTAVASAHAAPTTLLVTTLDRTGHAVRSQLVAENVRTRASVVFWSGSPRRLAAGRYEVFASISTPDDGSVTSGVRRLRVNGSTRLTIDARRGRPARLHLQPAVPSGYRAWTTSWLCDSVGSPVVGQGTPGPTYAIPSGLADVEFAIGAEWADDSTDASAIYLAGATHRGGVPDNFSRTIRVSGFTTLAVKGRTGLQSGDARVDVDFAGGDACRRIVMQAHLLKPLPYAITVHGPAGKWSLSQAAPDFIYGPNRTFAAGRAYRLTIGAAVWGPDGSLPVVDRYCHCIDVTDSRVFTDRLLSVGVESRVTYTLRKGKRVLLHVTADPDHRAVARRLPSAGWYTLTETATRRSVQALPAAALSLRASLRLRFHADPAKAGQVGGYVTRFVPVSLGSDNRTTAAATTVRLEPQRRRFVPFSHPDVRSIGAWASYDGGSTWHAVPVHRAAGHWSAVVPNPASGFVSLRARIVDADGNSATTQIIRAYAVR